MLTNALSLMGVGIGTVFVVLAIFFLVIKLLMKIFPVKKE